MLSPVLIQRTSQHLQSSGDSASSFFTVKNIFRCKYCFRTIMLCMGDQINFICCGVAFHLSGFQYKKRMTPFTSSSQPLKKKSCIQPMQQLHHPMELFVESCRFFPTTRSYQNLSPIISLTKHGFRKLLS